MVCPGLRAKDPGFERSKKIPTSESVPGFSSLPTGSRVYRKHHQDPCNDLPSGHEPTADGRGRGRGVDVDAVPRPLARRGGISCTVFAVRNGDCTDEGQTDGPILFSDCSVGCRVGYFMGDTVCAGRCIGCKGSDLFG